jgi:aminoglycoside 3-N-acetyltransferase
MDENVVIKNSDRPRTRESLRKDLLSLGLERGMTVIVHSSLSAIGWVSGGPVAVVQALMDVVTPEGTLVMPTQSANYSDPAEWENPPVPKAWHEVIRASMPAYDPVITPTIGMGVIVETFRKFPGTVRSSHPVHSFAAWGSRAESIIAEHTLVNSLGEGSPLARIYEGDGWVLLLGTGYGNNTSFHLAEYRSGARGKIEAGAPILEDGSRVWKTYKDIDLDEECFDQIGADFEKNHRVAHGRIGSADSKLFGQREAVDFAEKWLRKHFAEAENRD